MEGQMGRDRFVAAVATLSLGAAIVASVNCNSGSEPPPLPETIPPTQHPEASTSTPVVDSSVADVSEAASEASLDAPADGSNESSADAADATLEADAAGDASDAGEASAADALLADGEAGPVEASPCDAGLSVCNATCVDTMSDPTNCGGCSQACDPGELCVSGACECMAGETLCSSRCVNLTNDSTNCHDCGHSCQGGACVASVCQPSIIASNTSIVDIVVDSTNVYWTTGGSPGNVVTKPFTGGNPSLISPMNAENNPHGIAKDLNHVYWVDLSSGAVSSVVLVSGAPSQVFWYVTPVPSGQPTPGPNDVVVDKNNIYWVDQASGTVNQQTLGYAVSSTDPEAGAPPAPLVLAVNRSQPRALAVDANFVYWVDYGDLANTGSVNKVPIGGNNNQVVTLASGENEPYDIVVDSEGTFVYWTTHADRLSGGSVRRISTAGGTASPTILAMMQGAPDGIAIDPGPNEQFVYWTAYDDGTVMKAPIAGGTAFQMASNQNNPSAIAVDTDNVYWASEGNGQILKVAK
jgi:hypothetical protein